VTQIFKSSIELCNNFIFPSFYSIKLKEILMMSFPFNPFVQENIMEISPRTNSIDFQISELYSDFPFQRPSEHTHKDIIMLNIQVICEVFERYYVFIVALIGLYQFITQG